MIDQKRDPRGHAQDERSLDLLSRLERLHPKPPGPSFKLKVLRGAWIGAYFVLTFGPLWVWSAFQWRIHSSGRVETVSALVAIPALLAVIAVFLLSRRKLGMTADAIARSHPRWMLFGAVGFVGYLSSWSAVFLLLVAAAVQQAQGPSTHVYRAVGIQECRWRCNGCHLRASLAGIPAISGHVCVEEVRPEAKVGDSLAVSGYYFDDGIYVTTVRRSTGVEALPRP